MLQVLQVLQGCKYLQHCKYLQCFNCIPHICHLHHLQCRCQNFQAGIKKFLIILLTITTLVVVEWWWWHHHHHYNTTTITLYHHHHHSTTTVTIKFSCVAIYAVLLQNYFFSRFTRFWCQMFELKMVLVSKNYKYEVWL